MSGRADGGLHKLAIFSVSIGTLLIVAALVSGVTALIAFMNGGILIHTFNDIRTYIVRILFSLVVPIVGGVTLMFVGLRLLDLDKDALLMHAEMAGRTNSRKVIRDRLNVMLSNDEKAVMGLLDGNPKGELQSDIVIKTGYSKIKTHRILKGLEQKGFIRRGRAGITNKVIAID